MELEKIRDLKKTENKDEVMKQSIPLSKKYCARMRSSLTIENLTKKLRALVAFGLILAVLYIIVYNMFVPHSEKKEIPQEVIQTLLKLAAGREVQIAHYKDQDNSTQLLSNAEFK